MAEQTKLTIEQAFNNLNAVCEKFVGTKAEHIAVQESLETVKGALFPPKEEAILPAE